MNKSGHNGFVKARTAFLRDPSVSPTAKALLLLLRSYANPNGSSCFPSVATLAGCLGCDRKTVFRHLEELESRELLERSRDTGSVNRYFLPVPKTALLPVPKTAHYQEPVTKGLKDKPKWDGLGGQHNDGRRTMMLHPDA